MALATCLTSILLQDDHDHHLRYSHPDHQHLYHSGPVTTSTTSLTSRHHRCTLLHHHHFPDPVVTSIISVITTFVLTATLILSASASTSASTSPPPLAPLRPRPLPPRRPTIPNPSHQTPFPIPVLKKESKDPVVQFLEGELLIVCLYSNPGGRFASREKMSLLKNCRSFLSNFFFIPVAMLQRNSNMTRLWMFPLSSLSEAEKVLGEISNYKVQLEAVKAKIKSAKSKDESESLKFTQKKLINKIYTNSELSLRYCSPPLFQSNKMSIKNLVTASVCTTRKSSRLQVSYICAPSANDRCDT
ncbi:uncharacterized protein LOC107462038 isoform X13 [Arachis duranensis]|uniref:Uncharacterized protein LOC107462038 isoform X12 n=1 Tax=Arachis duranensis TaxID=130453 RepID=A0A9C6T6I1_ARADU|nr:uncharacterized protein LOC107462038 isoform X12 [Arachis duranensis]XP_052110867.1 uncharacterized protein LOC107462038 isoform X13 [Arachis duranensis]